MKQETDLKKLERRAKALLLNKDVPPTKMEIVRSIMNNDAIMPKEQYRAIIELLISCPDKKVDLKRNDAPSKRKVEVRTPEIEREKGEVKKSYLPEESGRNIDALYRKYRMYRIFKKRYLIHANNRIGYGLKKRLIPTRRCIKVFEDLIKYQESVLSRLQPVLMDILKDESIQDATQFNYLRLFSRWMLDAPFMKVPPDKLKWMDRRSFEPEIRGYVIHFFSFLKMTVEKKESLLLLIENTLRAQEDLKKETVHDDDSDSKVREKEKKNLEREKIVHEYLLCLRSFLPAAIDSESAVERHLRHNYSIPSLGEFLKITLEALVFQREVAINDITGYYSIDAPAVSGDVWDYSPEFLKKIGKDAESRKAKAIEKLNDELEQYDSLFELLQMKEQGSSVLFSAFETQLRMTGKKQYDTSKIYEENFLAFLDGCANFFVNSFVQMLDGSVVVFEDGSRRRIEGSLFHQEYFERERIVISEIVSELFQMRTNSPRLAVSRNEMKYALNGTLKSMEQVGRVVKRMGSTFYTLGRELHALCEGHMRWAGAGSVLENDEDIRSPLPLRNSADDGYVSGRPLSFHDCIVRGFHRALPLSNVLIGREVIGKEPKKGILFHITAFCLQMAFQCGDEALLREFDNRTEILKKLGSIGQNT